MSTRSRLAATDLARKLFGADHAYVQPHCGADANLVAFWAVLAAPRRVPALETLGETEPGANVNDSDWERLRQDFVGQRLLGMDYYSGGHLTHGYRHNVSGQMFEAHSYTVDRETHPARLRRDPTVRPWRCSREYFSPDTAPIRGRLTSPRLRELADEVGATFMVDMAHFAGLVAGKVFTATTTRCHLRTS